MAQLAVTMVPPEQRNFGRYHLVARIATGGMAELFLARRLGHGLPDAAIVVKRMLPSLANSERFVAMFRGEARVTARIEHPNVCKVYELGQHDGRYFIAMEYLIGLSLAQLLSAAVHANKHLDLRTATGLITQACAGVHAAHSLRSFDGESLELIHRDLSPPNLFVTARGVTKVIDFGVARFRGRKHITKDGIIKGKNSYMSPEQIRGEDIDHRSDIFSLGIVLWETLTSRRLFYRKSEYQTFKAVIEDEVPDIARYHKDSPSALRAVIDKALAREVNDRYQTAIELGRAITEAMRPAGGVARPPEIASFVANTFAPVIERQRKLVDMAVGDRAALTR